MVPVPEQIEAAVAEAVPPTDTASIETDVVLLVVEEQCPLVTTALYQVFPVKLAVVYVSVVPPLPDVTLAHPVAPSADCCHWIVPVCPDKVIVVPLPVQTVAAVGVAVPPTEVGSIVALTAVRVDDKQPVVAFLASA